MIHRAISFMIINVRARNKEMYCVREAIIIFWFSWWSSHLHLHLHLGSPSHSLPLFASLSLLTSTPSVDGNFHSSCYLLLIISLSFSYSPPLSLTSHSHTLPPPPFVVPLFHRCPFSPYASFMHFLARNTHLHLLHSIRPTAIPGYQAQQGILPVYP